MTLKRPLVGVISDRRLAGAHFFHMAGEKYLYAMLAGADVMPVTIPAEIEGLRSTEFLDRLDGLLMTGSPSNMMPDRYGGAPSKEGTWHDPERDSVALELIPAAIDRGLPLFAVCRGFQELNVVYGGTLHQLVHEVPGYLTHKENPDDSLERQYGPSHTVNFTPGGLLESTTGVSAAQVNSLHSQAIDQLGSGLEVEAVAEDGLVEGVVVREAPGFTLGVQWHPEWNVVENPVSMAIFNAFGNACRAYNAQ